MFLFQHRYQILFVNVRWLLLLCGCGRCRRPVIVWSAVIWLAVMWIGSGGTTRQHRRQNAFGHIAKAQILGRLLMVARYWKLQWNAKRHIKLDVIFANIRNIRLYDGGNLKLHMRAHDLTMCSVRACVIKKNCYEYDD